MFSPWIRLLLIASGFLLGIHFLERGQASGWLPIGAAVLLVVGHIRNGTVYWAFQAIRRGGDVERARRRLAHTMFPRLLNAHNRAYHAWLTGGFALHDQEYETARERLEAAFTGRLRTPRDRAGVALTLARLELEIGAGEAARRWVEVARHGLPEAEFEAAVAELELEGE
jgi:hypothetical protein